MLLVPAGLAVAGLYTLAKRQDDKMQELQQKVAEINKMTPVSNRYTGSSQSAFIALRQPQRVIPDVDLRGVPFYHVDYGSGALTRDYTTPVFQDGGYSYPM